MLDLAQLGREDRGQGVGAHQDSGVLTLLMIEPGRGGLQVQHDDTVDGTDGWIDVPAVPGAFVVNIGELMDSATRGYLKATVHRVVSPPVRQTRLSIPFFFNPALDSCLPQIDLPADLGRARPVSQPGPRQRDLRRLRREHAEGPAPCPSRRRGRPPRRPAGRTQGSRLSSSRCHSPRACRRPHPGPPKGTP